MVEASPNSTVREQTRRAWLDAATLDELREEIGDATVEAMLVSFEAEAARRVQALLGTEISSADLGRGAHALKGMALSVGAFALGDAAHLLERACGNAEHAGLDALRADLALCSKGTGVAVRAWLAGDG
ncbi:MAG: Hpt domain-containing protein [Tahibacter sp.]